MTSRLLGRLAAVHPNHRRIAAGAALIGVLMLASKVAVAAREIAIATRFGVGPFADAYQLSLTITTWIPGMLGGVMIVVMVPRLVGLKASEPSRRGFVDELNANIFITGLILVAATWLAAPYFASLLSSDPRVAALTRSMSVRMAPIAFLMIGSAYLSARMQARERFGYNASEAVPPLVICAFVAAPLTGFGSLVLGTLAGYLAQFLLLIALLRMVDPPVGSFRVRHRSEHWRSMYDALLLMTIGQVLITVTLPVDQAFAARLGEGAVATLGYANRLVTLFTGLGTVVVGRALLPIISGAIAENHSLALRQTRQWSILLFVGGLSITIVGWLLAPLAVRLLFERGAFGRSASDAVTETLRYGLLQLGPYFGGIVLVQWYAAANRFRVILAVTACALLLKIGSNAMLTPIFGLKGIMVSTAAMYVLTGGIMWIVLGRGGPGMGEAARS